MKGTSRSSTGWYVKANADLRVAEIALATDDPLTDIACYHAQQCAEKYLKGFLVSRRIGFKFVHELAYLVSLCVEYDKEFEVLLDLAAELQDYASDVRYPIEGLDPPSLEDAQQAISLARLIKDFVLTKTE